MYQIWLDFALNYFMNTEQFSKCSKRSHYPNLIGIFLLHFERNYINVYLRVFDPLGSCTRFWKPKSSTIYIFTNKTKWNAWYQKRNLTPNVQMISMTGNDKWYYARRSCSLGRNALNLYDRWWSAVVPKQHR